MIKNRIGIRLTATHKSRATLRLRIFFDGGARPNPGTMEAAVVARGVTYLSDDLGHGDCQEAEWLALIAAVRVAIQLGARDVMFIGDSTTVVRQASGEWPCRDARLREHLTTYQALVVAIPRARLRHVPRSKNLAGIALARLPSRV